MKLLDKFKDLFMDDVEEEEEVDIEEEDKEIYEEPSKKDVLPKVMREEIQDSEEEKPVILKEKPLVKEEPKEVVMDNTKKFNFTFDFDEVPSRENRSSEITKLENLKPLKTEKKEEKKTVLYPEKDEKWVKPKFKASPVISPVYGVLDKNYKKEEVKEKGEEKSSLKRPSKKVDFETVRKKAFGNLSDEIRDSMCENCELYKEAVKNNRIQEDNLLYDMTVEEEDKEVTIENAYNNYEEFGVAYEPKVEKVNEEEFASKMPEEEKIEVKEEIPTRESIKEEKIEVKEEMPTRESIKEEKEEVKVDTDFFELIDSMYKERSDN